MKTFRNNGYQWFQVAEVTYDNFMIRHTAADRDAKSKRPRSFGSGAFFIVSRRAAI